MCSVWSLSIVLLNSTLKATSNGWTRLMQPGGISTTSVLHFLFSLFVIPGVYEPCAHQLSAALVFVFQEREVVSTCWKPSSSSHPCHTRHFLKSDINMPVILLLFCLWSPQKIKRGLDARLTISEDHQLDCALSLVKAWLCSTGPDCFCFHLIVPLTLIGGEWKECLVNINL